MLQFEFPVNDNAKIYCWCMWSGNMTSENFLDKRFNDNTISLASVPDSSSWFSPLPLSWNVSSRRLGKTVWQCKQRWPRASGFGLQALLQTGVYQLSHGISSEMQKDIHWRPSSRSALRLVSWYEIVERERVDILILHWTGNALEHCNYTQHATCPWRPFISEFCALIF